MAFLNRNMAVLESGVGDDVGDGPLQVRSIIIAQPLKLIDDVLDGFRLCSVQGYAAPQEWQKLGGFRGAEPMKLSVLLLYPRMGRIASRAAK